MIERIAKEDFFPSQVRYDKAQGHYRLARIVNRTLDEVGRVRALQVALCSSSSRGREMYGWVFVANVYIKFPKDNVLLRFS